MVNKDNIYWKLFSNEFFIVSKSRHECGNITAKVKKKSLNFKGAGFKSGCTVQQLE